MDRPRRSGKRVRVGRTRLGRGVFAQKSYGEGEIVGEIQGRITEDPDYTSRYCYSMGDQRTLEPDAPFRFLNHNCQPNCHFEWYDIKCPATGAGDRRVFVLAMESIRPGEEFTIDYRWPATMAIPCRCGAEYCRGWIVDHDELPAFLASRAAQKI